MSSRSYNKVLLKGRLAADWKYNDEREHAMAMNRIVTSFKGRDGTEHVDYHPVVCFGKLAENIAAYTYKGCMIFVEARGRSFKRKGSEYDDGYQLVVSMFDLISEPRTAEGAARKNQERKSESQSEDVGKDDDDLPF